MKNAIKKLCLAVGGIAMCVNGQLKADILPVSPVEGGTVALHNARQIAFLSMPQAERKANFSDQVFRDSLHEGSWHPEKVMLRWMVSKNTTAPYTVTLYEADDPQPVESFCTDKTEVAVENLKIATQYKWRVKSANGDEFNGTFTTADLAPRMLRIENVPNFRDFGGRIGLDGRRIRQGLLYRSAGLNDNAEPVKSFSQENYRQKAAGGRNTLIFILLI